MRHLTALALLALAATTAGALSASVSPGMTRSQVEAALGAPVTVREASEHTYLFYQNGCGRACGMNDLVILRRDSVVDAIFRSPSRRYTGTSSSPSAISSAQARTGDVTSAPMTMPARPAQPETAIPLSKSAAGQPPAAPRQATSADRARLRQELLGASLTAAQIRARLRAEGYPADLLDADMRGAAATPSPMRPGAANDTRPSIPAGEPPVRPAPPPPTRPAAP